MKYAIVSEAPQRLKKGEYVIKEPAFLPEIVANRAKAPRTGLTGSNQLRYITDSIAMKYDIDGMNAWSVRPHLFEGRRYATDEELSLIVVEMLKLCCPKVFAKFVDYELNHLPPGTDMIYFVDFGVPSAVEPLLGRGFTRSDSEKV